MNGAINKAAWAGMILLMLFVFAVMVSAIWFAAP